MSFWLASVLQRLDVELKDRGEIYRQYGCQDLAGYRECGRDIPMPRVLLVIDEFQEFFVEDDKIAQEVTLLLDRLVRQGRAFGMHVILGSQTLGGQYSLPKATLGQMAACASPCSAVKPPMALLMLERGQHGRAAFDPPRRGDLQRRQRHDGGQQPLSGGVAIGCES